MSAGSAATHGVHPRRARAQDARKTLGEQNTFWNSLIFLLGLSLEQVQITLENGHMDILGFKTSHWNRESQ